MRDQHVIAFDARLFDIGPVAAKLTTGDNRHHEAERVDRDAHGAQRLRLARNRSDFGRERLRDDARQDRNLDERQHAGFTRRRGSRSSGGSTALQDLPDSLVENQTGEQIYADERNVHLLA